MKIANCAAFAIAGLVLLTGCTSPMSRQFPAPMETREHAAPAPQKERKERENVASPAAASSPSTPPHPGAAVPAPPAVNPPAVIPEAPARSNNSAVLAMIQQADRQAQTHKLGVAVATLERALRLEPRNPLIWHRLAVVRLKQGRLAQAADLAAKSNALLGENDSLRAQNDTIIAKAR
ncbi:MAG: hypothetical protein IDH49_15275 [Gammaproteobacteria bacterium]|nr:hypothetical protein [Gammaproteobacteria bacterium]